MILYFYEISFTIQKVILTQLIFAERNYIFNIYNCYFNFNLKNSRNIDERQIS